MGIEEWQLRRSKKKIFIDENDLYLDCSDYRGAHIC